ncbi:hypothetical protein [Rossellomorea aquimaris]|uniref:hypothetical protein n=1 Tax=Rossellomorea aquimaris TaxID=189382 RepID=UPI0011E8F1D8|nr:hypothetical protein [Rossellomorea aquimaris]TYS91935.1 hypothetical protein FZC88_07310 [Rossellomorea aquimaris]
MKTYKNQVLVLPMGMKVNANKSKSPNYEILIKNSCISMENRRKTLKIGNAIRLKAFNEDTTIENCRLFFEGTMTSDGIIPCSVME